MTLWQIFGTPYKIWIQKQQHWSGHPSLVSKPNEIFEAFVDVIVGGGGGKEGE